MIIRFSDLSRLRFLHSEKRIVLVGGCYDLLHVGHVAYLEKCRLLGECLVVSVSSDVRIKKRKGVDRPIISGHDRVSMLSALSCVDYALLAPDPVWEGDIPTVRVIDELQPEVFATSDSRFNDYVSELALKGTEVIYVPDIRITSTTQIIERIRYD